jgi:CYTH domain-containing protein
MGKEIERKFLVDLSKINLTECKTTSIEQGYLTDDREKIIRIRIEDEKSFITIKGKTVGVTRNEYEYEIPYADATDLICMCKKTISKKRSYVEFQGKHWIVDVFEGDNEGLVVAELEMKSEDEQFELPPWSKAEVSHKSRYYNSNLIKKPFNKWKKI